MTQYIFANNVNTSLFSPISSTATSLTLLSATNLPTLSSGQIMPLTLNDKATRTVFEIVYVTAISGTTLTVTRGQEGTAAQNWQAGDYAFSTQTAQATELAIQSGAYNYAVDTGTTANAYVVSLTPAIPATIPDGFTINFRTTRVNTGAATLNGTSILIPYQGGFSPLVGQEIYGTITVKWNSAQSAWVLPRIVVAETQIVTTASKIGVTPGSAAATNNTNLQNFLTNNSNTTIFFGPGTYSVTGALTSANGCTLEGSGNPGTSISCTGTAGGIITFSGSGGGGFNNIQFTYPTQATAGSAVQGEAFGLRASNFTINNAYIALECTTNSTQYYTGFQLYNYANVGAFIHDTNDIYFSQFIINAGTATNGALGGIRLYNKAEAIVFTDGDVLLGVYSVTTDAATYGIGTRPAYCNFTDVFFDSSAQGSFLNNIVESEFQGCWFSAGRSGTGYAGCLINTADSLTFAATRFFNCGAHGCNTSANAVRTKFIGCDFESNSVTAGSGIAHGLYIAPNTNDFTVIGCKGHNGLFTNGQQGYGVFVDAGTSNNYTIVHNDLNGNVTGALSDGGTGLVKYIHGNLGYVPNYTTRGWEILGNGLIRQWGSLTSSATAGAAVAVTFPRAFPTAVLHVMPCANYAGTSNAAAWYDTPTTTGVNIRCALPTVAMTYEAVGY